MNESAQLQLLTFQAELEALITEREAMLAANRERQAKGLSDAYGEKAILELRDRISGLWFQMQQFRQYL